MINLQIFDITRDYIYIIWSISANSMLLKSFTTRSPQIRIHFRLLSYSRFRLALTS